MNAISQKASSLLENITSAYRTYSKKEKNSLPSEEEQLRAAIKETSEKIRTAESNFNELTDSAAIDFSSYEILAAKARYSYLIKLAKGKNIRL